MGFSAPEISPHGPRITDIDIDTPNMMLAFWIIACICWAICFIIFFRQRSAYLKTPYTSLRDYYLRILAFPLVISSFSLACLFSVRPAFVWELAQHIYEAMTLLAFMHVLMALLGHDAHRIVQRLKKGNAARIWAAPPLLCFFRPCVKETYMTAATVRFTYFLVNQFVYIIIAGGFFRLWMFIDGFDNSLVPGYIGTISMIIAMQGLFMIYRASHQALDSWHPTFKFVTIKLIVLIGAVQKLIIQGIIKDHDRLGQYDKAALASVWSAFLLAIESPMFATAMVYAFPAEELRQYITQGLHHVDEDESDGRVDTAKPKQSNSGSKPADVDLGSIEVS
jgi:hypothetical protein